MAREGLRDRTKRLVRAELAEAGQDLFMAQGFDATNVEQIAAAAGMSKSSFFRYFSSKEDLVIGKYEFIGDQLADTLDARPLEEPAWDSMRRAFDVLMASFADPDRRERAVVIQHIVASSPTLYAACLQKLDAIQGRLTEILHRRETRRGRIIDDTNPLLRALVGAAFACAQAALPAVGSDEPSQAFPERLDHIMNALRPPDTMSGVPESPAAPAATFRDPGT